MTLTSDPLEQKICRIIVDTLRLKQAPETIDPHAPLFGAGLDLDSVDALELVMSLEHTFGIKIEDQEAGRRTLGSVASIATWLRGKGVHAV
jgi:acyl carrier protein